MKGGPDGVYSLTLFGPSLGVGPLCVYLLNSTFSLAHRVKSTFIYIAWSERWSPLEGLPTVSNSLVKLTRAVSFD